MPGPTGAPQQPMSQLQQQHQQQQRQAMINQLQHNRMVAQQQSQNGMHLVVMLIGIRRIFKHCSLLLPLKLTVMFV